MFAPPPLWCLKRGLEWAKRHRNTHQLMRPRVGVVCLEARSQRTRNARLGTRFDFPRKKTSQPKGATAQGSCERQASPRAKGQGPDKGPTIAGGGMCLHLLHNSGALGSPCARDPPSPKNLPDLPERTRGPRAFPAQPASIPGALPCIRVFPPHQGPPSLSLHHGHGGHG